ncbi:MAG: thiolase family protein [Elusimicrobia bacterium]|nr:thiolase family protein [Elusimicrobiota bacterium]
MAWDIAVLGGARTPFSVWAGGKKADGTPGGALRDVDVYELGAVALRGALARSGVAPEALDAVAISNVYPTSPQMVYGARHVSLRAGVPDRVPAFTPNMACGSGLYAILGAARELEHGAALAAAGGAENVSQIRKSFLFQSFDDWASGGASIGASIEALAAEFGVSREEQDRWAVRSHREAARAARAGLLAEEIVPAGAAAAADDAFIPDPDPAELAQAKPSFSESGTVTRFTSHALVDGAAALVLASPEAARTAPRPPLGRIRGAACAGVAAKRMGYGSVLAIRRLLSQAGLDAKEVDLFEINETFAAQLLIGVRELGLPEEKVNVNGGALALGHPFAATGCRQVLSLLLELRRRKARRGVASICVGGGQGIAVLVEA